MRKPNLFIVGAPRCGTTALATYLAEHPQVFFSLPKEPFYWSTDFAEQHAAVGLTDLDQYLQLFQRADEQQPILAEGSTSYLQSQVAIERILEFNPAARFIAMVRNPLEMAHSRHQQLTFSFQEEVQDFEEAWRLQATRRSGRSIPATCRTPQFLQYGEGAKLSDSIQKFFESVPAAQRKVIVFDDFQQDTRQAYRQTLEFLGLPNDGRQSFARIHDRMHYRFGWLHRFVRHPPALLAAPVEAARRTVHKAAPKLLLALRGSLRVKKSRGGLRPEFTAELREYFSDDVRRLSSLLDRDLMHWVGDQACAATGKDV